MCELELEERWGERVRAREREREREECVRTYRE